MVGVLVATMGAWQRSLLVTTRRRASAVRGLRRAGADAVPPRSHVGQWRWQALQRVDALPARRLLVIMPHAGGRYLYGERRLSAADYADIARCAQHFLHPAQTSTPSTATTTLLRCWYQDARSLSGAGSSLFGLFFWPRS